MFSQLRKGSLRHCFRDAASGNQNYENAAKELVHIFVSMYRLMGFYPEIA